MQRTKAISTTFYKTYKSVFIGGITLLILAYMVMPLFSSEVQWMRISFSLIYLFIAYKYWYPSMISSLGQMKNLSYDDENLYVTEEGREEQIPFHDIRDVEIMSLDGIYKFNFFNKKLHNGFVTCKTSMWYPFNFPKVDKELNRVRALINKAHREYKVQIGQDRSLASYN